MSDRELINGCIKNETSSQKALYDKYAEILMAICIRYTGDYDEAEDQLQEGFITIFKKIIDFRFEGSLEGWMKRIVINQCLKHLKEQKKLKLENLESTNTISLADTSIDVSFGTSELLDSLLKLPVGYRTVFNMYVMEGFSHKEIANFLKIEESTSRSQLAKAKIFLKNLLEKLDLNEERS